MTIYMTTERRFIITILAGGEGKRMHSDGSERKPKVLYPFHGEPMILRILKIAIQLLPNKIFIIVGKYRDQIERVIGSYISDTSIIEYIDQPEPKGTGDAIKCSLPYYKTDDRILILNGDMPCITHDLLQNLLVSTSRKLCTIVGAKVDNPFGYGRIEYNAQDEFRRIIEERDCTMEQKKIDLINAGIYLVTGSILASCIPSITNENSQREYYFTDLFLLHKKYSTIPIFIYEISRKDSWMIQGVNTIEELEIAEKTANHHDLHIKS